MNLLRKHLGQIEKWSNGEWKYERDSYKNMLAPKYKIKEKGFRLVMKEIKQRISSKAVKVRQ
mgnify:CR=1 FL=1